MSNMLCQSQCHQDPEVRGDNKVSRLKWIPEAVYQRLSGNL